MTRAQRLHLKFTFIAEIFAIRTFFRIKDCAIHLIGIYEGTYDTSLRDHLMTLHVAKAHRLSNGILRARTWP